MKVYEYAKKRNIKSKDVVKRLHEMGFDFIKNHLSLVPEKILDELNDYEFSEKKYTKKVENIALISMEYNGRIRSKIKNKTVGKKIVILPSFKVNQPIEFFCELEKIGSVYRYLENDVEFYYIDLPITDRQTILGHRDESYVIATFCKAVIELLKTINEPFDIINVHDWPLGLFPLLFELNLRERFPKSLLEYTVYGPTYKGIYGEDVLKEFNIDMKYYHDHTIEHAMSVNLLKAGLMTAKKIDINKNELDELKNSYLKNYIYDNL